MPQQSKKLVQENYHPLMSVLHYLLTKVIDASPVLLLKLKIMGAQVLNKIRHDIQTTLF